MLQFLVNKSSHIFEFGVVFNPRSFPSCFGLHRKAVKVVCANTYRKDYLSFILFVTLFVRKIVGNAGKVVDVISSFVTSRKEAFERDISVYFIHCPLKA